MVGLVFGKSHTLFAIFGVAKIVLPEKNMLPENLPRKWWGSFLARVTHFWRFLPLQRLLSPKINFSFDFGRVTALQHRNPPPDCCSGAPSWPPVVPEVPSPVRRRLECLSIADWTHGMPVHCRGADCSRTAHATVVLFSAPARASTNRIAERYCHVTAEQNHTCPGKLEPRAARVQKN